MFCLHIHIHIGEEVTLLGLLKELSAGSGLYSALWEKLNAEGREVGKRGFHPREQTRPQGLSKLTPQSMEMKYDCKPGTYVAHWLDHPSAKRKFNNRNGPAATDPHPPSSSRRMERSMEMESSVPNSPY